MKKLAVLVMVLLLVCAGCGQGELQGIMPEEEQTAVDQVEVIRMDVQGEVSFAVPFPGGYLAQSYDQQDEMAAISLLDSEGQALWTYEVKGYSEGVIPVGDDLILLKGMRREYTALDGGGNELWRRQVGDDFSAPEVFLPDRAGGVFAFGSGMGDSYAHCLLWRISAAGEVRGPEPYTEIPGLSVSRGWAGERNDYWLDGSIGNRSFLARLDSDLRPLARFDLKKNQYPQVAFFSKTNQVLLYGQAYRGSGHDGDWFEYGLLYEIDYDCNLIHSATFEGQMPNSVARLKDGRWMISFYTRDYDTPDPVYLYSADWKQKTELNTGYGFVGGITALDDGGYAIVGALRHPPSVSSFIPKVDLIYSRYNAAGELLCTKTFYAKDSKSGYGVYVLVDSLGRVLID